MKYPFSSLPDNLAAFSATLRRDQGFRVGPGELADAARALELVDVADERTVRDVLRPVLSATAGDAAVFDEEFTRFFLAGPAGEPQDRLPEQVRTLGNVDRVDARPGRVRHPGQVREEISADAVDEVGDVAAGLEEENGTIAEARDAARALYSPVEVASADAPGLADVDSEWLDTARRLVRRVHLGLSRRWRPARKGRRFDARRTLRASLQTGGEALTPRWQQRQRRAPRFVVLIDGSRSMGAHAPTGLKIGAALASVTRRAEVFTFSTALQRVTHHVRRETDEPRGRLAWDRRAWGGGTSIGPSLQAFLQRFGATLLGPETVVFLLSDGLDVGEPEALRAAMRTLHRRSAGIVWLNPLRDTHGYAPTARGMRTALPYITTFASANDRRGFEQLARTIRVRV